MSDSIDGLVEAYDTRTGVVQRVPPHFLGDPILGRFLEKTPAQRLLDGDLGDQPTSDSTVTEIRDFATTAGIDVTGLKSKDDLLDAVTTALGGEALPTAPDPNAPTDPDATPADADTPAAGEGVN